MKKLILVRHAKSSWEYDLTDINRPLKKRGITDTHLVSEKFLEYGIKIDLLCSSDAVRALTTAEIFAEKLQLLKENINIKHDLYDFSGDRLIDVIKNCSNSVNVLMIFGHNFALTNFVNVYGDQYIENVPTCGLTIIDFKIKAWENINKGITSLTIFPRDLKL